MWQWPKSRYLLSLEERIVELKQEVERVKEELFESRADERKLLDRIILLTTGVPMDPYKPAPGEAEATPERVREAVDSRIPEPFKMSTTLGEEMARLEKETMEAAYRERARSEGVPVDYEPDDVEPEEQHRREARKTELGMAAMRTAVAESERVIRDKVPTKEN